VPQIVLAGQTEFSQTETFPYTHAMWPDLAWEAEYATTYLLANPEEFPDPRIGLISLNNTLATSHIAGTVNALGDQADAVFPPANRLQVEPSVVDLTSQLNQLKAAGVNVLYLSPGAAALISALKYVEETGWPVQLFLYSATSNVRGTFEPAGPGAGVGVYTPAWLKDPADPRWADDASMQTYRDVVAEFGAGVDPDLAITAHGYSAAQALVLALEAAAEGELTGEAINAAWLGVSDQPGDLLMPGSTFDAGPCGRLVYSYRMTRFDGTTFEDLGELVDTRELGIAE